MDRFNVPKDSFSVAVRLEHAPLTEGFIFLERFPTEDTARKKLVLFLESEQLFFPFSNSETGKTEFINKKLLRSIELHLDEEKNDGDVAVDFAHREPITAILEDGETIDGELLAEVPEEKSRLSDCLNMNGLFLNLLVDGAIVFLNKRIVEKVVGRR